MGSSNYFELNDGRTIYHDELMSMLRAKFGA